MGWERILIERGELYRKAWKTPIQKLAKQYGISDVGVKKICKKFNVSTPPRGYWEKVQAGQTRPRLALPKRKYGEPVTHEIARYVDPLESKLIVHESEIPLLVKINQLTTNVPKTLHNPHPSVKATKLALNEQHPDEFGVLRTKGNGFLDIRVSPSSLSRALRIIDSVIKNLVSVGIEVVHDSMEGSGEPFAYMFDEKIRFSIHERVKRSDHVPTKKELEKQKRSYWERPPQWDYAPTGKLTLSIDCWGGPTMQRNWSDTKRMRLEDRLGDFLVNLVKIADFLHRKTLEYEEERCKKAKLRRIQEEVAQRRAEQERKLQELEAQADEWNRSIRILAFVKAAEQDAIINGKAEDKSFLNWVEWARRQSEILNPLDGNGFWEEIDKEPFLALQF